MIHRIKSLPCLIIYRILDREKSISIFFILSLLIISINENVDSFTVFLFFKDIVDFITSIKDLLISLSVSLVSGIIVYFLTIVLPEERKKRLLYVEIEQTFLYLESSFIELATELQIGDYENPIICAKRAVTNVKKFCCKMSEDEEYSLGRYRKQFSDLAFSFNKFTDFLLGYSSIMSENEIYTIINIRHRKVSKRILFMDGVDNILNIQEIEEYFNDIAILYKDICSLHEAIQKKTYKKKFLK